MIKGLFKKIYYYMLISRSGLFDRDYYLRVYSDVRRADIDPLRHFITSGWKEGRNPSSEFDSGFYLKMYPDVRQANINPLVHYIRFGQKEKRASISNVLGEGSSNFQPSLIKVDPKAMKNFRAKDYFVDIAPFDVKLSPISQRKKISVVVTTYNHEKYIEQCLESILMQKGDFNLEIIIRDDHSSDNTSNIISRYSKKYPEIINNLPSSENLGVTRNLQLCLGECNGRFIAICEGDDYWIDEFKLEKQMNFLIENKKCSMVFSSIIIYYENLQRIELYDNGIPADKTKIGTEELIGNNFIGNFSCCMYRADVIRNLPRSIYDIFTVDWMFNIACSEMGKIGFLREYLSVYRKHAKGAWSSKTSYEGGLKLLELIDLYDDYYNHRYHTSFLKYKEKVSLSLSNESELLILDTVFPHKKSPFRYQEFTSLLEHFPNSLVLTTGEHFPLLKEDRTIGEVIAEFNNENSHLAGRVVPLSNDLSLNTGRLAYIEFLFNLKRFFPFIERQKIPFIFTLYPGGGFQLNESESDDFLRKVTSSPMFRKMIVTQKLTHDYILERKFCSPEQIELIYGVVTPVEMLQKPKVRKYYGFDKDSFDVCFVAHKYVPKGKDKGYDIFIEVAKKLSCLFENIHFHVVGDFDETDIPITGLAGKITFYGVKETEWFRKFYSDIDVILSPNIPNVLQKGSFDGFPTASCTEAGAQGVAIMCTDPLKMNNHFVDGEEIVIVPHDVKRVVEIISDLYKKPEKLKDIAEAGAQKIRDLYSFEKQLTPRIEIIQELLGGRKQININIMNNKES